MYCKRKEKSEERLKVGRFLARKRRVFVCKDMRQALLLRQAGKVYIVHYSHRRERRICLSRLCQLMAAKRLPLLLLFSLLLLKMDLLVVHSLLDLPQHQEGGVLPVLS
jgi:hypothetical protein